MQMLLLLPSQSRINRARFPKAPGDQRVQESGQFRHPHLQNSPLPDNLSFREGNPERLPIFYHQSPLFA